jgi:uncharacterized OsmC-like protein
VTAKLEFFVTARRVDESGSLATCKDPTLTLDTALAGRRDALNPAELLVAALSACMIKGIERVVPMLKFSFRGVEIRVHGVRQDVPTRMERIEYEIIVDTDEPDRRLELLHDNVKKYGTVFNTVAPGTDPEGRRGPRHVTPVVRGHACSRFRITIRSSRRQTSKATSPSRVSGFRRFRLRRQQSSADPATDGPRRPCSSPPWRTASC